MSANRSLVLLLLALGCKSSTGPATPSLSGTVSAPQHGTIAHATVIAADSANPSAAESTTTNSAGRYAFYNLPTGTRTVSVPALSLPGGCFAPETTHVAVTAGRDADLPFVTTCIEVAGMYTGYATVITGGDAAALETELGALGLSPLIPDSVGLTFKVSQGDSTFAIDAYYQAPETQGSLFSGFAMIKGPFVVTPLSLQIDTATFVLGSYPFTYTLSISATCQTSGPQTLAFTEDSTHLTGITGDAAYACTIHLPGIADFASTFAFHAVAQYTGPLASRGQGNPLRVHRQPLREGLELRVQ